ncbi:7122_t:CDS:2, partial [Racocetra fulgida]
IDEKIEYVDAGGSGVITKAKWIKKKITVVLKTVIVSEETNSDNDEFIKEQIKAFHNIGLVLSSKTDEEYKEKSSHIGYENVIKFYGVSRYRYHVTFNLHQHHTKNVVIKEDGDGVKAIITDFGLSKVLTRNSKSNQKIEGYTPFVDPMTFNHNATLYYKSDIYSLGVVLWEITSNEKPINESTVSYVKLYSNCWDGDPKLRPEINQVYESIHQKDIISGENGKIYHKVVIHHKVMIRQKVMIYHQEVVLLMQIPVFGQLSTEARKKIQQISD